MFGLLQNMYPKHPVRIDIAGTVGSIQNITADLLYKNYRTFYHPSNMTLFVVGQINPEETMELIKENQNSKEFAEPEPIHRFFPDEDLSKMTKEDSIEMDVTKPKVSIGVRGEDKNLEPREALRFELAMEIVVKLLFGISSTQYLKLYDQGIIDDSYSYEFNNERSFNFLSISSDTKYPTDFIEAVQCSLLLGENAPDFNEEHFEVVKRRSIGQALGSLNSLEYVAQRFVDNSEKGATIFDIVPILEDISFDEVKDLAKNYIKEENISVFKILPKDFKEKSE